MYHNASHGIKKKEKQFGCMEHTLDQKIELVTGMTTPEGDNYLIVGTIDSILILKIIGENGEFRIQPL